MSNIACEEAAVLQALTEIESVAAEGVAQTAQNLRNGTSNPQHCNLYEEQVGLSHTAVRLLGMVQYAITQFRESIHWNMVLADIAQVRSGLSCTLPRQWSTPSESPISHVKAVRISMETVHWKLYATLYDSLNTAPQTQGLANSLRPHDTSRRSVYIIHAGEDKDKAARLLYRKLRSENVGPFLDQEGMLPGEETKGLLRKAMDGAEGAVVLISPELAAKKWPMDEVAHFLNRSSEEGSQGPFILPVFYRLGIRDMKGFEFFASTDGNGQNLFVKWGFFERAARGETSVRFVRDCFEKLSRRIGVENTEGATNEDTEVMLRKREELFSKVSRAIVNALIMRRVQGMRF